MEREPGASTAAVDYRLIAMRRVATAERELQLAGSEGFRIATVPECSRQGEGMFILHRTPGTSSRFDYRVGTLRENTASELLGGAEAGGFRVAQLFNDVVVLERVVVP